MHADDRKTPAIAASDCFDVFAISYFLVSAYSAACGTGYVTFSPNRADWS